MKSVYIVTRTNTLYDALEDMLVFGSRHAALKFLSQVKEQAEQFGALGDYNLNFTAPYVYATDEDNMKYLIQLNPHPYVVNE